MTTPNPAAPHDTADQPADRATRLPAAHERWRCGGCGNLTRFDMTRTRRTREFWHFDLAGDHRIEETEVLDEEVASVACRWCGRDDAVELVARADVEAAERTG